MASRDLTKTFSELRREEKARRPRTSPHTPTSTNVAGISSRGAQLLDEEKGGPDWAAARKQLPPQWVDVVDKIDDIVRSIQDQMKDLSGLHRKRLLVSFDDSAEESKEREIQVQTDAITDLFREAERRLNAIMKPQSQETDAELKVRQNLQRSLAFKIQKLSGQFRAQQKEYLQKLQAQKEGVIAQFEFLTKEEEPNVVVGGQGGDLGFTQAQIALVENVDTIVNDRDQEIQRIAKSIEELASVMKHLAELVIDQGTVLDRIDYNMDQAVEHVEEGVKQLEATEKTQKEGNPIKCIIALLVLIFVLVLIEVIKHTRVTSRKSR